MTGHVTQRGAASGWIDQGRVLSGAMHYFRVHPDQWQDRLQRLAAMGLDTVETYIPWNFHERVRGEFDFAGWRDVVRFIRLAETNGLGVIVRPGPFICAEWDNGGLPTWLGYDHPVALRTSDPRFLAPVDEWFDELLPLLVPLQRTNGGPIVAVQVENEYGSFGSDREYLVHLHDGLRARGIDVPLFTSDGPTDLMIDSGTLPEVDVTANFGSGAENAVAVLRRRRPGQPIFCAEFWGGWFDHWGRSHNARTAADVVAAVEPLLDADGSVNVYMAHGGTSFGTWPGANIDHQTYLSTVTSYDSDAPIGEAGELREKFWALRELFTETSGRRAPAPPPPLPVQTPRVVPVRLGAPLLTALRGSASIVADSALPLAQEELRQPAGVTLYESTITIPQGESVLRVHEPRDRAWVFLDGELVHRADRNTPDDGYALSGERRTAALSVVIENEGRVNFGRHVGERKGLLGGVSVDAHGVSRLVHGWRQYAVDIQSVDEIPAVGAAGPASEGDGIPGLYCVTVDCEVVADAFLALPGWEKVYVRLNGFLLGRLDRRGPQRTLYAPAPLWLPGDNEIDILSMGETGEALAILDTPDLGPVEQYTSH